MIYELFCLFSWRSSLRDAARWRASRRESDLAIACGKPLRVYENFL
ncbi:MAG: hypothetical protein V7K18_21520 [Nostoc sp.]